MPFLEIFFFGFTLWLGAYLLARHSQKATLHLTGWGLLSYALALSLQILFDIFPLIVLLLPPLLWIGAALALLPEEDSARPILIRVWAVTAIPLAILTLINAWLSVLIILALIACVGLVAKLALRSQFKNTLALLAVIALFVTLSTGLLLLPLGWIPFQWGLLLLGLDLVLLGLTIIAWDAFDEGQSIRTHLVRSLIASVYYAGILAALVLAFDGGLFLLVSLVAFGILTQTFSDAIQSLLDGLTLSPNVNDQRLALRQTVEVLPLLSTLEPGSLDEEQFTRLTRRALSHLGDLPKLAANPLVNLRAIRGENPLDRAHALKTLLIQHIQKLKPQTETKFGTSDEWRYYNAVYFPYVLGLKPYTRRADHDSLDEAARAALAWFQTSVPERTLRNWQNMAAKMITQELMN